jgi:hypothetical protein
VILKTQERPVAPVRLPRKPKTCLIAGQRVTGGPPVTPRKRPVSPPRSQSIRVTGEMIRVTGVTPVRRTP